ncbi:hypothetical protein H5T88_08800 [bacterium]|nr:hypothetical protein [bacterium]
MDLDRLVQLVEAEVRRLLSEGTKSPPPQISSSSGGEGVPVLVIMLHTSPPSNLLQRLREQGKNPVIWQRNLSMEGFEEVWLSELRVSDVAKMALGLFDTPALEAVFQALSSGKKVYAEPLKLPQACPPALANLLKGYWETLLSYGVIPAGKETPSPAPAPSTSPPQRMIITQDDIREAKEKGLQVMLLPPNSIVTDMARELAERLGIQIKEEVQS